MWPRERQLQPWYVLYLFYCTGRQKLLDACFGVAVVFLVVYATVVSWVSPNVELVFDVFFMWNSLCLLHLNE